MTSFLKACFLSTAICFIHVGCAVATSDETASIKPTTLVKAENANGYTKPGATVALRHDYQGQTLPGQLGEMSIDVVIPPTDAIVTVSFAASDGLSLVSGGELETVQVSREAFANNGSPIQTRKLQFRANEDGRYYITAFVSVAGASGIKQSRVVGVPVPIGTGQSVKKQPEGILTKSQETGRSIIVMDANETIE